MALPHLATPLEDFFDETLHTGSYAKGTKGLGPVATKILAARTKTQQAVNARNEAKDHVVMANVAKSLAWDELREPLESLELQTAAHFDKDRPGYAKVFAQTVPALMRTSEDARAEALKPVLEFARKPGHTGKLAAAAKEVIAAWDEYQATAKESTEADEALATAIANVAAAKQAGIITMREADGTLRITYSGNPGQAKKFFRVRPKSSEAAQKAPADSSEEEAPPATPPAEPEK